MVLLADVSLLCRYVAASVRAVWAPVFLALVVTSCLLSRCSNRQVCDAQPERECAGSHLNCRLVMGVMSYVSRVDDQSFVVVVGFAMLKFFANKSARARRRNSRGMNLEMQKMVEVEEQAGYRFVRQVEIGKSRR